MAPQKWLCRLWMCGDFIMDDYSSWAFWPNVRLVLPGADLARLESQYCGFAHRRIQKLLDSYRKLLLVGRINSSAVPEWGRAAVIYEAMPGRTL